MINKKLLSFDRGALRYVELNVLFQWLGMLCNVVFVKAVAGLIGAAFAGSLTSALLRQQLVKWFAPIWEKTLLYRKEQNLYLKITKRVNDPS